MKILTPPAAEPLARLLSTCPIYGQVISGSPQYEGVTLADGGRLVVVSEPNYVEVYRSN